MVLCRHRHTTRHDISTQKKLNNHCRKLRTVDFLQRPSSAMTYISWCQIDVLSVSFVVVRGRHSQKVGITCFFRKIGDSGQQKKHWGYEWGKQNFHPNTINFPKDEAWMTITSFCCGVPKINGQSLEAECHWREFVCSLVQWGGICVSMSVTIDSIVCRIRRLRDLIW